MLSLMTYQFRNSDWLDGRRRICSEFDSFPSNDDDDEDEMNYFCHSTRLCCVVWPWMARQYLRVEIQASAWIGAWSVWSTSRTDFAEWRLVSTASYLVFAYLWWCSRKWPECPREFRPICAAVPCNTYEYKWICPLHWHLWSIERQCAQAGRISGTALHWCQEFFAPFCCKIEYIWEIVR